MTDPLILILSIASITALVFVVILTAGLGPTLSGFLIRMAIFRSLFSSQSQGNSGQRGTVSSVLILVTIFAIGFSISVVFSSTLAFFGMVSAIAIIETVKRV
ncbi:hypothetical protein D3D01_15770 [Haloarcula sp. Atlit-7R]|nr:hypothetical protein D3D01_15770 [Haloarcula sp. Atlit-7R]